MTVAAFFKYVEIQTKVASVFPYLVGTLYALYRFDTFDGPAALLMLGSLLLIDMATTAVNNYQDYRKAKLKEGYGYEVHNAVVAHGLSRKEALGTIFGLLAAALVLGILLVLRTGPLTLLIGIIAAGIGMLYSFGPASINRTPYGEAISGITMGFGIVFLLAYVHAGERIASLVLRTGRWSLTVDPQELLGLILVSLPLVTGIANIMLANNLCDLEEDERNHRLTLVVAIGRKRGLVLFKWLYVAGFAGTALAAVLGFLPIFALLLPLALVPILKNVSVFSADPHKGRTFVLAVKNFVLSALGLIVVLGLGLFVGR
jgi:1,4-dihydroxy-2-naphthoate octaprenyltransferase